MVLGFKAYCRMMMTKFEGVHISTHQTSQDYLELFFSCQRAQCGQNNNPTELQYGKSKTSIIVVWHLGKNSIFSSEGNNGITTRRIHSLVIAAAEQRTMRWQPFKIVNNPNEGWSQIWCMKMWYLMPIYVSCTVNGFANLFVCSLCIFCSHAHVAYVFIVIFRNIPSILQPQISTQSPKWGVWRLRKLTVLDDNRMHTW